ncbi:facilitated trehalose transporter Tret1-like [Periplaneta americana]|uniref:facilitated trehalose transporter Tret1-like n=1 Tax=Periplaneta americana TaxID=6978 RepID=UPI0037E96A46
MFTKQVWKMWQWGIGRTLMATIAAHGNSISVGLCQGYSAVLLPQLMQDGSTLIVTKEEASWIASLGVISNPIGALLAGILMEIFGRKTTVKLTSLPYIIGWVLISLSDDIFKLYAGRFISGVAVGMATASYVYVAEISKASHRGTLSASGPVHVSLGVLAIYTLGFVAPWQRVAAMCTLCALLSFAAMCAVPESPPWLASHGRTTEALAALVWLRRNPATAEAELAELQETVLKESNNNAPAPHAVKTFLRPTAWKPFLILLAFFAFQEASGIYIILYYAVNLFQDVGTGLNEYVASIVVGGVRLVMSVVGAVLMRSFGRRTLAVVSGLGMAVSMAAGGGYEHLYSHLEATDRPLAWVPLICVLAHVCVSMVGFLQLPWVMSGELFPLAIRGVMGGLVASLAHLFIFTSVKTYPDLMHSLGTDGTLWLFGASALCGALYCYMFLPETRGKTLREIELEFSPKESHQDSKYTLKSELGNSDARLKGIYVHQEGGEVEPTPVFTVEGQYTTLHRRGEGENA